MLLSSSPPPPTHTHNPLVYHSLSLSLYISPLFAPPPLFRSFFSLYFSPPLSTLSFSSPLPLYTSPLPLLYLQSLFTFSLLSLSLFHFLCPLSLSQISFHPPPFCPQCCGNNPVYCGTENLPSHSMSCCEHENHPSFTPELLRFQNFYLRSFHKEKNILPSFSLRIHNAKSFLVAVSIIFIIFYHISL